MLANQIPQEGIGLAKTSTAFKHMKRGDALKCKVWFRTASGQQSEAGLVCWHDPNMVYCFLSNDSNNFELYECSRRGLGGIIWIPQGIGLAKTSTAFEQMKRGDDLKCKENWFRTASGQQSEAGKVWFRTASGQKSEAGLVCWRE
jgi:hypothetical protein